MLAEFHFLRPLWLLSLIPILLLIWHMWHQRLVAESWHDICDSHLLNHLIQAKGQNSRKSALLRLLSCGVFLSLSLAGPTWSRFPVPTYQPVLPHVLLLDMTEDMLVQDLPPNRLSRAKFKLHDLFMRHDAGQFGLVVYTGEPFVLSPLTDDGHTIDTLLETLSPDIMPVGGHRLDSALEQAGQLIEQAGFNHGDIMVLTSQSPSASAIDKARTLAKDGNRVSIMPILGRTTKVDNAFKSFASAGDGQLIPFSDTSEDLDLWLNKAPNSQQFSSNWKDEIPVWRDQGRWFLLPALVFLIPLFRRGWLQRLDS